MRGSLALLGRRCRHAELEDLRAPFASPERLTDSWSWPHSSGAGRCRLRRGPGTIRSRCPPGPPGRAGGHGGHPGGERALAAAGHLPVLGVLVGRRPGPPGLGSHGPQRRWSGISRRSPDGPSTALLAVNDSSTVATAYTGLSPTPHRMACSSPVTGTVLTRAMSALSTMVTATARTPRPGRYSASARASAARRARPAPWPRRRPVSAGEHDRPGHPARGGGEGIGRVWWIGEVSHCVPPEQSASGWAVDPRWAVVAAIRQLADRPRH
jgi:hypothetical protein